MIEHETKRVEVFVPNERMGEFLRRVEGIQGQARKLGLPEWDIAIGEKEWRKVANPNHDESLVPGYGTAVSIEGAPVSITGQAPVLAGWRFLAKIEHGEGNNLVKRMVGGDLSPPEWHSCGPDCDHCSVSRARKNTYMLESVETGEVKQVGSSCVSDFLGQEMRDPERIAAMFDHLADLGREFEYDPDKELNGCSMGSYGFPPAVLMATVLKIVQEDGGYLSADKAESLHCLNTGDRLRDVFWAAKPTVVIPDVGHVSQATQVVSWLQEQKTVDSLWLRNIAYLADRPCVTIKDAGLFASGYVAWNRELQKGLRAERGSGDWIGEPGGKISSSATLERVGGYDNAFGHVSVLSFRDEEGNGLVWKTQSPPRGLLVGSLYHVSATVKAHGDYKGDKQTEVIRAKVAELELFSFGALPAYKKLAAVASPDVCDESGHSPLLKAVWGNELAHAKVLLSFGADANQLNQSSEPILGYAVSTDMAHLLIDAGARAVDLTDSMLGFLIPEVREVVDAALVAAGMPPVVSDLAGESVDVLQAKLAAAVLCVAGVQMDWGGAGETLVSSGLHCGRVLSVLDGIVTQKVSREGGTVAHAARALSLPVVVGQVVDIKYVGGVGVVSGRGIGMKASGVAR